MVEFTLAASARIARGPIVLYQLYPAPNGLLTGADGRFVTSLDKHSLREQWRRKTKLEIRTGHGPVVVLAYYDEMQGWDEGGHVLWRRKTSQNFFRRGDRLYCNEQRLEIISVPTGSVLDVVDCPEGALVTLVGDVLIVTDLFEIDPVRAFHVGQRRVLWTKNLASRVREQYGAAQYQSSTTIAAGLEGRCVLAQDGHLVGFSATDGEILWHCRVHVPYFGLSVKDGRIPIWTTAPVSSRQTTTLEISSGRVTRERTQPAVGENRLVIVQESTGEVVIDRPLAAYGEAFQQYQQPQRGTLCNNHIVFTTRSGLMAVFRLSDGELVWQYQHEQQLFYPVFEDNRLYVASADGDILLFEARGGDL